VYKKIGRLCPQRGGGKAGCPAEPGRGFGDRGNCGRFAAVTVNGPADPRKRRSPSPHKNTTMPLFTRFLKRKTDKKERLLAGEKRTKFRTGFLTGPPKQAPGKPGGCKRTLPG